jgi:micrococcal nuclease
MFMRTIQAALLLMLCFTPCRIAQAQTEHHLTAAEAKNHVGETATVCGRVASAHFAEKTKGLPTFLNLDRAYPNQIFTVVIWGADRLKFGNPESTYRNKNVCVSGKITSHRDVPEIVITTPGQIRIQK